MSNETKQTAVDWLQIQFKKGIDFNPLDRLGYTKAVDNLFEQAKEMEKDRIIRAYNEDLYCGLNENIKFIDGEDYYNAIYGGNK
jgi:hypothetical protein